jgi:seryl-tRNA synthetase
LIIASLSRFKVTEGTLMSGTNRKTRLTKKIDNLQKEWDQLEEKLASVRNDYSLEVRSEEKLRIAKVIKSTQAEQLEIEKELNELEEQLEQLDKDGIPSTDDPDTNNPEKEQTPPPDIAVLRQEVITRIRQEIRKLFEQPKLQALRNALLETQPQQDRVATTEDLLVQESAGARRRGS